MGVARIHWRLAILVTLCAVPVSAGADTATLTTLYSFSNYGAPEGGLILDSQGNLYGTSYLGGANQFGSVFRLSGPNYQTFETLFSFNETNGAGPNGRLLMDSSGNLFGTTEHGGASHAGTVFQLSGPNYQSITTLATFNGTNGANPGFGGLTADASGNLYGITTAGNVFGNEKGTAFKLSGPNHQTLNTLVSFGIGNGSVPAGALTMDTSGNILGVTNQGGSPSNGTVFQLSGANQQTLTKLINFGVITNGVDNGSRPGAGLTADTAGNFYGTTVQGGGSGYGVVFRLSGVDHKTLSVLHRFNNTDGANPNTELLLDAAGNIYGTTRAGGAGDSGTLFKLSGPNYDTFTTLIAFNGPNGYGPEGALIADGAGTLFGTTWGGGTGTNNAGTVFRLTGTGFVTSVPEPASLLVLAGFLPH